MDASSTPMDMIDVEVFRKALENLTNEMTITLKRASGSTIVVDTHDFCTAIFDAQGEQLAFSGWVTMHSASSIIGVQETVKLYGRDSSLTRGDAIVLNDPYTAGALHQADVGIVVPLFDLDDVLIGWSFSNVHMLDIGGLFDRRHRCHGKRRLGGRAAVPANQDHRERSSDRRVAALHH